MDAGKVLATGTPQQILADTWDEYSGSNPPSDDAAFRAGWMQARADALRAADMNPVFE